ENFCVAFPKEEHKFRKIAASVGSIHNLQRFAGLQLFATIFQPLDERFGFRFETKPAESVQGKTSVPDPGITIAPVSPPADLLRQTKGRRSHYRSVPLAGQ